MTDLVSPEALLGPADEASIRKEVPHLRRAYRHWIQASPFAVRATRGPNGLDAPSARGDTASING
jgi:predicted pyridoxine 5'-phosphate oxidase superfamily flavin-nucleotide-binding protein